MRSSTLPTLALALALLTSDGGAQAPADQRRDPIARMPALELVSRDSQGQPGGSWSGGTSLSADGRYVAFHSYSDDLVPGDTNGHYDVFVRDRTTGATERVSVDSAGSEANGSSAFPAISADGRFVAFASFATNLVAGDANGQQDVFVHDRESGATVLASRSTAGLPGDGRSERASISADGRFVAFQSFATDLAPDPNGFVRDAFVHDLVTGTTQLVSVGHLGQAAEENCDGTTISADGRWVAFETGSGNLVPDDTNATSDVFVRDRLAGTTVRASVDSGGAQSDSYSASPALSADGRFVAFQSGAALVPGDVDGGFFDIYVRDLVAGETCAVTSGEPGFVAETSLTEPSISADGSRIAFTSAVIHYPIVETSQVHVHDRASGVTSLLSQHFGALGNDDSAGTSISADGRAIGFESRATNLVLPDRNAAADVFLFPSGR